MTEMSLHRMPFPEERLKTKEQILNEKYKEFSNSGLPFNKENGLKWQLEAMREYGEQLLNMAADISESSVRPSQRIKALINHEQYKNK